MSDSDSVDVHLKGTATRVQIASIKFNPLTPQITMYVVNKNKSP